MVGVQASAFVNLMYAGTGNQWRECSTGIMEGYEKKIENKLCSCILDQLQAFDGAQGKTCQELAAVSRSLRDSTSIQVVR